MEWFISVVASEPVTLLVLVFVLVVRLWASWFALQPVRKASGILRRLRHGPPTDDSTRAVFLYWRGTFAAFRARNTAESQAQRTVLDGLIGALAANSRSVQTPEIAQVCASIRIAALSRFDEGGQTRTRPAAIDVSGPGPGASLEAPHRCEMVEYLHDLVALSLEPRSLNIVTRFLVWGRWEEHALFLESMNNYLDQFLQLRPTVVEQPNSSADQARPSSPLPPFGDMVSAVTGSVVLADLTTPQVALSTTRCASWHDRIWLGEVPKARGADSEGATSHPAGHDTPTSTATSSPRRLPDRWTSPYDLLSNKGENASASGSNIRLGRFNGRIPVLLRAEVTQVPGLEEPVLLLVTGETDYTSTENHVDGLACKKLDFRTRGSKKFSGYSVGRSGAQRHSSGVSQIFDDLRDEADSSLLSRQILRPASFPAPYQLNGKVTFISRSADGRSSHIILMNRAAGNDNGYGIAATTAGGALSLPASGELCDGDRFGALDPLTGIRREVSEELGLEDDDYSVSLHAVVQHNSRPQPQEKNQRLDIRNGDMTATCLAIAHTPLSPQELSEKRFLGSASVGLAEAEGLIALPLTASAQELYQSVCTGSFCPRCSAFVAEESCIDRGCGRPTKNLLANLEQMALVSVIYCSALIHGVGPTIEAWRTEPLWLRPNHVGDDAYARVCAHPADLTDSFDDFFAATFPGRDFTARLGQFDPGGQLL